MLDVNIVAKQKKIKKKNNFLQFPKISNRFLQKGCHCLLNSVKQITKLSKC